MDMKSVICAMMGIPYQILVVTIDPTNASNKVLKFKIAIIWTQAILIDVVFVKRAIIYIKEVVLNRPLKDTQYELVLLVLDGEALKQIQFTRELFQA